MLVNALHAPFENRVVAFNRVRVDVLAGFAVAAPAIVRVSSLMPVKAPVPMTLLEQFDLLDDRHWRISNPPMVSNPTHFNVKDFFPWADPMADVIRPGIFPGCEPPDGFLDKSVEPRLMALPRVAMT